ncbi:MAG: glycosyltransferase family 4 protein [Bacteroidetes bacterium]|nr:glycosyltransferase family 4 protein [Bacteroidota bacterium]MCA6443236.1 glycosyltransferase family 4 protein [Bacteroidota bacterium]
MILKFAYLSAEDPHNKKVWSGTHYSIFKHLKTIGDVDVLGPYEPKLPIIWKRILNQLTQLVFKKRIAYRHSFLVSKALGKAFSKKLANKYYDFIIAPAASGEIAFLDTNIPIIYITDGTFNGCINYHQNLSHLSKQSAMEGELIEMKAIEKSAIVIASSEWCKNSVIQHYHKNSSQVFVIPYGANLEKIPTSVTPKKIHANQPFRLLFVGVYWHNKGGPIAMNAFLKLKKEFPEVELTILGCEPDLTNLPNGVTVIPFLDKNSNDGQLKMAEIFNSHHVLLLPTRFDCTPIVINEASAFALPSLVSKTGGVEGHLKNSVNGHLIDYNDDGTTYAAIVSDWLKKPELYEKMSESTLNLYCNFNNWVHWTEEFKKLLLTLEV